MQGRGCQQAADVSEGVEAVAALKWWGTLPEGMLKDLSFGVIRAIMKARSAAEVLDAGKTWLYVSQNFVAAELWPPFATFSSVCPLWADFQGGIRTVARGRIHGEILGCMAFQEDTFPPLEGVFPGILFSKQIEAADGIEVKCRAYKEIVDNRAASPRPAGHNSSCGLEPVVLR